MASKCSRCLTCTWRGLLLLLPVVFVAAGAWTLSSRRQEAPPVEPTVLPVRTIAVEAVDQYTVTRTFTGSAVARRASDIGFPLGGTLVRFAVGADGTSAVAAPGSEYVRIEEGDHVAEGQPLAMLDTRQLEAQRRRVLAQRSEASARLEEMLAGPSAETIAAARARVAELEAQQRLAQATFQRTADLYADGVVAQEEYDEGNFGTLAAEARLEAARAQLAELEAGTRQEQIDAQRAVLTQLDARLESLDIDIARSVLRAPFSGTIAARLADEGAAVTPGQPVFRLVEDDALDVRIGVPLEVANRLDHDGEYTLVAGSEFFEDFGARTYAARLRARLPELNPGTRTVTLVFEPLETDGLSPGQIVRLEVPETMSVPIPAYRLPTTALVESARGLWSCYVVVSEREAFTSPEQGASAPREGNGYVVERREVEVLHTAGDYVLVRGTVQEGERLLAAGAHRVVPGQRVRSVDAGSTTARSDRLQPVNLPRGHRPAHARRSGS